MRWLAEGRPTRGAWDTRRAHTPRVRAWPYCPDEELAQLEWKSSALRHRKERAQVNGKRGERERDSLKLR
jgi:hypothetical protein